MILVTGGAGYVGSVLVKNLLEDKYKVRVFDKLYFGKESLKDVENSIELVQGDVRNFDDRILDNIEAIIHLAGLSNDPTSEYNPKANIEINTEGTKKLALAAKKKKIKKFIFASSCSVYYTTNPDDTVRKEVDTISPTAPYSLSKYLAEKELLKLSDANFCPVILRKGTVFGLSPRMRYDLVINTMTKDAFTKRRITINAGGRMWRPLLDINDATKIYEKALRMPNQKVGGHIFNVLNDNYRVIDIANKIKNVIEKEKGIKIDLDVQETGIIRSYRVSNDKLKQNIKVKFNNESEIETAILSIWNDLEIGRNATDPIYYNIAWMELLHNMEQRLKTIGNVF